jgi:hypothetical protein
METKEVNISDEIKALQHKKDALEKVMKIARAVEQLRYSLEAVVLLGKPTGSVSKQFFHVYESLSEKIRIQPTKKIQQSIERLDGVIASHLNTIMEIARPENYQALQEQITADEALGNNIDQLVREYRKNAQTAVALRVALRERGVPTSPIKWAIKNDVIQTQIAQIKNKESHYRKKVKTEIINLQADARLVANNPNLPRETRDSAAHMHDMLQRDLDHINAGKDIASMPFFVEVVELREGAAVEKTQEPQDETPQQVVTEAPPPAAPPKAGGGFFYRLWRWVTTPPSVTWQDIKKGE